MTGAHFGAPGSAVPSSPPGAPPAAGDAGSSYLSDLLKGPMDPDAGKQLNTGGDRLKQLAQDGDFAVNEAGFQAYKKAIDEFLDGIEYWKFEIDRLAVRPKMGSSTYSVDVANFNVKVYNGDPQSLLQNLELMSLGLSKARDALETARKNYREAENAHAVTFAQLNKKLGQS